MTDEDDQSVNKLQLQVLCQKVLIAITKSVDRVPMYDLLLCLLLVLVHIPFRQFRHIFKVVKEHVDEKFGSGGERSVGALMFLRFLSPALVAPQYYALSKGISFH